MIKIPESVDLLEYMRGLGEIESDDLHGAAHWTEELHAEFDTSRTTFGATLPWGKTHNQFRVRPGEVTIHAGINGHRKSLATGQIALWLARRERVCIASFEMYPAKTLARMVKQAAGSSNPPREFREQFLSWADDRVAIYDRLDTTPMESVLALCYYAGLELGIKHVFIDSLAKCGIFEDDYNTQKDFMDRLAVCARATGVHIHVVAHMRKAGDEYQMPGKFGVKGSGALVDLCDNLIIHWKNKRKEEALNKRAGGGKLSTAEEEALEQPCQILKVEKQRHGEHENTYMLWFHRDSLQFTGEERSGAMPFSISEATA